MLDQAKATEAHSLKLRETLAAAEANAAAYTAKYHLLEASTSAGSARVRAIEERMTAQDAAVAALSEEKDKALGELRKARDLALEATPLALAGSRRDNAHLRSDTVSWEPSLRREGASMASNTAHGLNHAGGRSGQRAPKCRRYDAFLLVSPTHHEVQRRR